MQNFEANEAEQAYFDYGVSVPDKAEVIAYALKQIPAEYSNKKVLMVGDRSHDIIGAKKNGIDCAGVLFGYGSREELEEAGADFVADSVEAVRNIVFLNAANDIRDHNLFLHNKSKIACYGRILGYFSEFHLTCLIL